MIGRRSWLAGMLGTIALTVTAAEDLHDRAEAVVRRSFSTATPEEWRTRLAQDEVQALCSRHRDAPPAEVAARVVELSRATLRYPDNGRLMGNWREGEKLASIGTGGHIGRIQPDRPGTRKGGNCYACHVLAPKEMAAGNLGPSLAGYGKIHGTSEDAVRFTYQKIFNAQAWFPCTHMPRFGANGWLTPDEIADAVAFLLDPESPVNR
ncbi:MAG: sulfur oxidation c-type cytochrome SoxX [Burkholderiales bacterium]|nr:sulfur oxidation c-type cytochrome SoxX [Burkholderiales bacterium]